MAGHTCVQAEKVKAAGATEEDVKAVLAQLPTLNMEGRVAAFEELWHKLMKAKEMPGQSGHLAKEEPKLSEIVSCGSHEAASCAECPQGHGEEWCNGDCTWVEERCCRQGECGQLTKEERKEEWNQEGKAKEEWNQKGEPFSGADTIDLVRARSPAYCGWRCVTSW